MRFKLSLLFCLLFLIFSSNVKANNTQEALLTCNDPITNFRWNELCKKGFDVSFMVDYFQGKFNNSSYEDYRMCDYYAARIKIPTYEESGKTKEEFYGELDEMQYLGAVNFRNGLKSYFAYSVYVPFMIFNPSVTINEFNKFIFEDNQRIGNKTYEGKTTYSSLTFKEIAGLYSENCLSIMRPSYLDFVTNNNNKPYGDQIIFAESQDTMLKAFTNIDKEGKVESISFEEWFFANNIEKNVEIKGMELQECPPDYSSNIWSNCYGTYAFENGDLYTGQFKDGSFNGEGSYTYSNGQQYIGDFKNGYFEGHGTKFYSDGDIYVGGWKKDKKYGQGAYSYINGSKYVGGWKNDKKHGQGTYSYQNNDLFLGEWENGKKHGQGTLLFAGGASYLGEWKDDMRHGFGAYTFKDGASIRGYFKNDQYIPKTCLDLGFAQGSDDFEGCVNRLINDL
tara:strand:+ start:403 stop:1752 length:1350 start_codon:yes stop_codon:yes gene_type:complete